MRLSAALLLASLPAAAHAVSMSTGEARLTGSRLDYEVRMPLYEVAHLAEPERQIFQNVHFHAAGSDARLLQHSCRQDASNLICTGLYLFERDVDRFDVRCTFASITVPNHVHLLRAVYGDHTDQAAFDGSFTEAVIRFRPPTGLEIFARDVSAGFWRAIAGVAQLLFLAALVLAGRSRRELFVLAAMFMAGQAAAVLISISARLPLSPRFVEAAAALTIAYLAVEVLLLPHAGQRWLVVSVLGVLHGVYFDLLLTSGDYARLSFLAGVFVAEAAVVALCSTGVALIHRALLATRTRLLERAVASALFVTGISWFFVRLRS